MLFKYLAAGAGALALILGIATLVQHNTIEDLEAANAVLESSVAAKDATIDEQNAGILALEASAKTTAAAVEAAGARIGVMSAELAAERARRNAKVEKDYALPDCAALLATDLAAVCPAHAQRLRDAARRLPGP